MGPMDTGCLKPLWRENGMEDGEEGGKEKIG